MIKKILFLVITTCAVFCSIDQALSLTLCKNIDERDIYIKTIKCPNGYEVHKNSSIKLSENSVNVDFYKLDIHNIFRLISEVSGIDILVDGKIKEIVTLKADEIGVDELVTRLIIQYDLVAEMNEGFISIGERSNIYETKTINEVDGRTSQANTKRNIIKSNVWDEKWQVDFQHANIREFVAELNLRTGRNIEVGTDVDCSFSLKGTSSTQKIFKTVLTKTSLKLIVENGKYIIVRENSDTKQPEISSKRVHNMICDVYMYNGNIYLGHLVNEEKDKSITVSKRGLSINYPYGQVRLVDNCTAQKVVTKPVQLAETEGQGDQLGTPTTFANSSSDRPIGTVVLDNTWTSSHSKTARVWQIVTTNNIVDGFSGFMKLDTGEIIGGDDEIDSGIYNKKTKFMTLEHHYFKYKNIQAGFTVSDDTFKISGTRVLNKQGKKIGVFHPNKFLLNGEIVIPKGQGCPNVWGNSQEKVYFTKRSKYFTDYAYPRYLRFFCSEQEAVNAGYKKSLK